MTGLVFRVGDKFNLRVCVTGLGDKYSFSRLCKFSFLFRVIDLIFAPVCQDWFSRLCDKFILFVSVTNLVLSPVCQV